ncbi:hypothetical protein Goshw_020887 [Gossypium schwendimanii]|uniref:histone acetyltransferase n=2 Tax=Gossypium TaxID=3633 RepID=A0A7J9L4Q8_GOSSC|nr:hypothetical protein [Gossypium schwendimanii]
MVPNKWLPVRPRMSNTTYYDPSVADARFPFAGQNQSFCPVTEQAANHGYLPPLYLQEPLADATNRLNRAIQRKVLLAYIQYKNSAALSGNDAPAYFANYMHSTVCCQYVCRCTKFFSLASHYDGCRDARCDICNTVRYNAVVDTFRPDFEHVKGGLLRVTGSVDSGQPTYGSSEAMQPLLKRLKLENPTAPCFPCHGMFYTMAPSHVQPSYAELPPMVQFSESPVSYNSEVTEVGVELLPKLLDGSTIANRMGMNMEVNTELLPYLREDSTSAKEMELLPKPIEDSTSAKEMDKTMEMNIELLPKPIEDSTSPKEMGHNMEEWSIELISKLMEDSPSDKEISMEEEDIKLIPRLIEDSTSAKEINMNIEEENVQLMSKLIEDSSNAKEMGKDVAESFPGPPEVVIAGYKVVETDPVGSHREEDIGFINVTDNADNARYHFNNLEINALPSFSEELAAGCEEGETEARANSTQAELATKTELIAQESNGRKEIKLESLKQRGVSLIENFTAQQIKEHISSLRECIDQDLGKKEGANRRVNVDGKNSCQLCGADKLSLAPAPIYCSSCCARIRRSAKYYSIPEVDGIRYCLCSTCYKLSRSESITTSGILVSKAKLIKKINDEEAEEWWVQCDKCKSWQHQICALFNEKKNKEKKDCFLCPKCCLEEIENGEHKPPLVKTVFGAKDLPPTMLSDHLEQRLFRCLQKNREEKAKATGMSIDEVPEVEGLVVREVLSTQKLVKVNEKLLDILKDGNYPAEFPYKSKVILLFQKIDGADVCLFIMYAQEFGAECSQPNQRCVYISYLDSVKYFRPEAETAAASGEPLRTVVYHEIMIGYLDYCKKRGFATCYIWACPPKKGEDYIFYFHPEIQKIPKSDKLRQWHKTMLLKAAKMGIVVGLTNLYDQFFSTGQYNSKVTAANLPYFDGDYWSGAAEDVIKHIEKASGEDSKKNKKIVSKRTLKAMGHTNPPGHATKDILLMQKLGQNILPMKEDFIIAHLQFVCVCCHRAILDGWRWFCRMCKSFQLCGRCHDAEQYVYKDSTHTSCNGEKHSLSRIMVDVPYDTDDNDASMDSGLFENRYRFLLFCQKNNYQFDTLRRAKHSSMMILYYLHNPTSLLAETTCCICDKDTPLDQCWQCKTCSDFFVCAACYHRHGCSLHVHKLSLHPSAVDSSAENRETLKKGLSKLLEVLLHASGCDHCSHPECRLMKKLFFHSKVCTVRAAGGCKHCNKIWFILRQHSRSCKESDCNVPRCRDIKQHAQSLALKPAAF